MADLSQLRQLIIQKWPEAVLSKAGLSEPVFHTGIASLDALFPRQGIPYGQLIEITGTVGCGKTSLLFMMMAALTKSGTVAYIDLSGSFFPTAAASCGVDVSKLSIVKPDNFVMGLRSAELLLSHQMVDSIVVDLTLPHPSTALRVTGSKSEIAAATRNARPRNDEPEYTSFPPTSSSFPRRRESIRSAVGSKEKMAPRLRGGDRESGGDRVSDSSHSTLLHRLRQQVARSKALVIFLTDNSSDSRQFLPASIVALRLEVSRLMTTKGPCPATSSPRVGSGLVSDKYCHPERSRGAPDKGATQGRTLREEHITHSRINITVTKSRISREGAHTEVLLNE